MPNVVDEIFQLFETQGHRLYFGEAVSEKERALQSVLHDIGHLLHGLSEDIATHGLDGRHDAVRPSLAGPALWAGGRVNEKEFAVKVTFAYRSTRINPASRHSWD